MNHTIRPFTRDDIPAALGFCAMAGWNQTHDDWMRLFEYQPDGCFAADVDATMAGTVTTTSYGTDLAWIGMVLVHEDYRRRGIAMDLITPVSSISVAMQCVASSSMRLRQAPTCMSVSVFAASFRFNAGPTKRPSLGRKNNRIGATN